MRKFAFATVLVLVLACSACKCVVQKQALKQIRSTHDLVLPDYVRYVEADTNLNAGQKDDRKKLAGSLERLVDALKDSLED